MLKAFRAELHPEWVPRPGSSPPQWVLWESRGACRAWDRLGATLLSRGATFLHPPVFLVVQWERICLPRQEAQVRSLSREDPLEEETATPSQYCRKSHGQSLGGYHPWGHKDVGHNLATENGNNTSAFIRNNKNTLLSIYVIFPL